MAITTEKLNDHFKQEAGCSLLKEFTQNGLFEGKIAMAGIGYSLEFDVSIMPMYPFQFFEQETIRFINEDLLEYGHVGIDGAICIHTSHSPDFSVKLTKDVASLREWIEKYYIGNRIDNHYEHLKLPVSSGLRKQILYFTDTDHTFEPGQTGDFYFSLLTNTKAFDKGEKDLTTYLLQHFEYKGTKLSCQWNNHYKNVIPLHKGLFIFLERQPTWAKHFAFETWDEFKEDAPKYLLDFLNELKAKQRSQKAIEEYFPLLVGYNIPNEDNTGQLAYWQLINIPYADIPIKGIKGPDGKWTGEFIEKPINWQETKNCSYNYYFGRGRFCDQLTNARILIIGVGAIGSAVAVTLARCGATTMGFIDYDNKEPENVCRSEFFFSTGVTTKVAELSAIVTDISPFCEIVLTEKGWGVAKFQGEEYLKACGELLNKFDFIIDCSTDNDVAYLFDKINPSATIINLSITNHAKDLVCAISPDSYKWLMTIFSQLQNDTEDMYNPTGCWSPTFRASYNDINLLVQYALKHLSKTMEQNMPLRSFYLSTFFEKEFNIKLNQV